jgi:lipopolysaccharide export system permease protein
VALGGVVGALAFQAEPWGLRGIHKQLNELIKRNVAGDVRPGIFNEDIPRFTLFVGGTATNRGDWTHVLLHDASEEGAPMLLLSQQGKVESDGADALLRLNLRDGELHRAMKDGTYTHGQFDQASIALGVSNFLNRNRFIRPAGELPFGALRRAATSARANHQDAEARVLETAYYARIAALFTCVIFGLIAVPLAIGGRGARGRSFAATVLAFATYYVVQTVANGMGEGGRVTPLVAAWIPNVIGLLVAMALAWRLRHGQQAARR